MSKKLIIVLVLIFGVVLLLCCCCGVLLLSLDSLNPKDAKLAIDHEFGIVSPPFKTEKEYFTKTVTRDNQKIEIDVEKGGDLELKVKDLSNDHIEFSVEGWALARDLNENSNIYPSGCGKENTFQVKRGDTVQLYTCSLGVVDIWTIQVEE